MKRRKVIAHFATPLECTLILLISAAGQMTHFSAQQGRAVICADSAQYVNSAEAIISGDKLPHFEMRKPGYVLFLTGVALALGNMGWAAIACNHALLALLPLAAYAFGRHLHSRPAGWLAAFLTIAQLQVVAWGNRMMAESLFVSLLSFGLLLFVVGLSKTRTVAWMASAGCLLGLSWLTKGTALPVVATATVFLIAAMWHDRRRAVTSLVSFVLPIAAVAAFECGLNLILADRFRPANGTAGAVLAQRMRYLDGVDVPATTAAMRAVELLLERDRREAYLCNAIDVWTARYHAIHDRGMNEWEYDDMMARFGRDMVAGAPLPYLVNSAKMAGWHLLRRPRGEDLSPVADSRRAAPLIHPAAPSPDEGETYWFAYWGLPHLSLSDSIQLVDRMKAAASERAPFGGSRFWSASRYYAAKPIVAVTFDGLRWLAALWPGFALIFCALIGLDRRMCCLLAVLYVAEALLIGLLTYTGERFQFIWLVTDTVLAAAAVVAFPSLFVARARAWLTSRRPASGHLSPNHHGC